MHDMSAAHAMPCLFQHDTRWRSSNARVYAWSFAPIIERLLEKLRWTCPPHSTLRRRPCTGAVCRACRQARHSTSRLFPVPKCMGSTTCRVMKQQVEFGLTSLTKAQTCYTRSQGFICWNGKTQTPGTNILISLIE